MPGPIYGHLGTEGRPKSTVRWKEYRHAGSWECKLKLTHGWKMWNRLSHVSWSAHNCCQTGMSQLLLGYAGARKTKVVVSDLLVIILIVQRHNFATFWCGKGWDLLLTHNPNADEPTCTITHTKFYLPSLFSRLWIIHEIGISWACVACKLKIAFSHLYTYCQVMTPHILRWMAITVHQCSAGFIQEMIEGTEDMNA